MIIFRLVAKIFSWIVYALTLAAAFCGFINPNLWALPAMLVLLLPYLTILTAILTIVWAISMRWITAGLGALTIFAGISSIGMACPVSFPKNPTDGEPVFTLITYNITHARDRKQPDLDDNRAIKWLIAKDADIVVLQELYRLDNSEVPHFRESLRDSLLRVYPYVAADPSTDRTVISKFPVKRLSSRDLPSNTGAYIDLFRIRIHDRNITLVACHLYSYQLTRDERNVVSDIAHPSRTRSTLNELETTIRGKMGDSFRERARLAPLIREVIDTLPDPLIVCGDFNDVPASWVYRTIRGDDLHDAFSETAFGPAPTYNDHFFFFRIDQILYRGDLEALSVKRGDIDTSDHYPLIAKFALTPAKSK